MLSIVAFGLYIWNSSQLVRAAAIIVSVVDFISLMLALIVGNSNIKRYQINNYICCPSTVLGSWNEDQYVCKDIRSIWICA